MAKQLLREFFELKCDDRGCRDLLNESEKKMLNEGFLVFPAITQTIQLLILKMRLILLQECIGMAIAY